MFLCHHRCCPFACRRGPNQRCTAEYQARLSGPLLDRIDLHVEVALNERIAIAA